jgi:hypothetical protein
MPAAHWLDSAKHRRFQSHGSERIAQNPISLSGDAQRRHRARDGLIGQSDRRIASLVATARYSAL